MKHGNLLRAFVPACVLAASGSAMGQAFDFEAEIATGSAAGGYTSLSMVSGAQTLTITRSGGTAFDVVENSGVQAGKPAHWGRNSLSPFFDASGGDFICDFALGINSFSVEFGDYEPSDDDEILLEAWSGAGGTGTFLGSIGASAPSDTTGFDWDFLGFGGSPAAMSIVMKGGSADFPASLFWDNIVVESVPEPATFAVLGLGVLALRRRRKA